MKRFLFRILLILAFVCLFSVLVCTAVDPFNVFHPFAIRDNGVEPNKNFIKMSYLLKNPERFDALIFGSSRVSSLHPEQIAGMSCYNMTYSGGLPEENLANVQTLLTRGVALRRIYLGVDEISFSADPAEHLKEPLRSPYEYSRSHPVSFWKLYLDPAVSVRALGEVIGAYQPGDPDFSETFYRGGWVYDYGFQSSYSFEDAKALPLEQHRIDEAIAAVRELRALCEKNGVELLVFTNPIYRVQMDEAVKNGYLDFLKKLAEVTPFYNFSGYNDITMNSKNYADISHYTAETGDLVLAAIQGQGDSALEAQGFGRYVTQDTVDMLIAQIEQHGVQP